MKLLPDAAHGPTITGYGPDWIAVNGERFSTHIIVDSGSGSLPWQCAGYESLGAGDFEQLSQNRPELVIFGSGARIRFPRPEWLQSLYALRIGVETMDTQAACRTYNFLAGEGRKVVAALLLPT